MPRRFGCLLLALVVLASPQPAAAVNLFFMPGDAFFSARLSEEMVSELPDGGGTVMIGHHWLHSEMYLCGYAGFARLEVREMPPEVANGLKTLYRELRKQGYWKEETILTLDAGEQERTETNPFHLFVYDRSFDPRRFEFGLKYNEKWADLPEDALGPEGFFKTRFEAIKYEKFVSGEEAIIRDWKDGPRVPGPAGLDPRGSEVGLGQQRRASAGRSTCRGRSLLRATARRARFSLQGGSSSSVLGGTPDRIPAFRVRTDRG